MSGGVFKYTFLYIPTFSQLSWNTFFMDRRGRGQPGRRSFMLFGKWEAFPVMHSGLVPGRHRRNVP